MRARPCQLTQRALRLPVCSGHLMAAIWPLFPTFILIALTRLATRRKRKTANRTRLRREFLTTSCFGIGPPGKRGSAAIFLSFRWQAAARETSPQVTQMYLRFLSAAPMTMLFHPMGKRSASHSQFGLGTRSRRSHSSGQLADGNTRTLCQGCINTFQQ